MTCSIRASGGLNPLPPRRPLYKLSETDRTGHTADKKRAGSHALPPFRLDVLPLLIGQRIGTDLEVHDLAGLALAAFDMSRRAFGIGREQALALPSGRRIVEAPVHALGVIAHRIGN